MTTEELLQESSQDLMRAAWREDLPELKRLLPIRNPMAKDDYGLTALMISAWRGDHEAVALLLPVSCLMAKNFNGKTAQMIAERHGCPDTASLIQAFILAKEEREQLTNEIPEAKSDNNKGARL